MGKEIQKVNAERYKPEAEKRLQKLGKSSSPV